MIQAPIIGAFVGHLCGDYIFQNDQLAQGKKKSSWICAAHCLIWTVFVMCLSEWAFLPWASALVVFASLFATHFVQDRTTLVRKWMHLIGQDSFAEPPLGPWSIIVVDNVFHILTLFLIATFLT
jgi:hypothetical protein